VKAFLMHDGQDFDLEADPPPLSADLAQDLELGTLWNAMAAGDQFLYDVAQRAVLNGLTDPDAIAYRQEVLTDCLASPAVVRNLYDLAVAAVEGERKVFYGLFFRDSPDVILHRSVEVLEFFTGLLKALRAVADEQAGNFRSAGFSRLFATLSAELSDEYFAEIGTHLGTLRFRRGVLISARLGPGNKGTGYVLRKPREQSWRERLPLGGRDSYNFQIADRDEAGLRALSTLQGQGTNLAANATAQSADHILSFFRMLRAELAFYIGCLNVHDRLADLGEPVCLPVPRPPGRPVLSARELYDACLALHTGTAVVGNDVQAHGKSLIMITGANQGGKSTFLRSVGLAQLMMQAGMFVAAREFEADVRNGVFTHYKREEDAAMEGGKLDEELGRMSRIIDRITAGSVLLCNESFAATNEREGSEIARQIIGALLARRIKVGYVTHLFDLADGFHQEHAATALFLRAERQPDGQRTFRVTPGAPLPTSHGEDVYQRIFAIERITR
jgi:MutS domain V